MDQREKIPKGVWAFWILVVTAGGLWWLGHMILGDQYGLLQTVVLALTLIAIVWYTFETHRMQEAVSAQVETAVRQTNLGILPIFVSYIGALQVENEREHLVDVLELENIGNGVALNIIVDKLDVELDYEEGEELFGNSAITFDAVMSIPPGQREIVPHKSETSKPRMQEVADAGILDWMDRLKPERAVKDYELTIRFMDILGNRYVQVIHIGKSGCWPDIVTPDDSDRARPSVTLISPFTEGVMRMITARERRELWRPRLRKRRP
jgi:hypothetical protein